jgi:hypothetical protein
MFFGSITFIPKLIGSRFRVQGSKVTTVETTYYNVESTFFDDVRFDSVFP